MCVRCCCWRERLWSSGGDMVSDVRIGTSCVSFVISILLSSLVCATRFISTLGSIIFEKRRPSGPTSLWLHFNMTVSCWRNWPVLLTLSMSTSHERAARSDRHIRSRSQDRWRISPAATQSCRDRSRPLGTAREDRPSLAVVGDDCGRVMFNWGDGRPFKSRDNPHGACSMVGLG